ncbi:TetR/AcrR family transcriptional regulator [Actinomadura sp. 7K507]|uniref:TetR/AcrR family transcriptional regulator n=1 Tax=Actinomadura sp. 7K507 TaxID=2530365 RepID=UPI001050C656|nr:TetR/AcrR family transcriptional regulator [Actinomadura sp. 7K507]TDC84787.1 TetR/AcrR family transcriptional regulator [Actinomadura sp. 7K507]
MAAGRRQRRDAVANKERILQAAEDAFRNHGLSVDMRAVAASAGVGVGTLYRHFPTREDLLHAITGADFASLALTGIPAQGSAIDGLREFFNNALTRLIANKAIIDLLAGGAPSDADFERCLEHLRKVGREAVERSVADHTLAPDVTADDIAYSLLGLIRIAQLIPEPGPRTIEHHVELTLRGLAR